MYTPTATLKNSPQTLQPRRWNLLGEHRRHTHCEPILLLVQNLERRIKGRSKCGKDAADLNTRTGAILPKALHLEPPLIVWCSG